MKTRLASRRGTAVLASVVVATTLVGDVGGCRGAGAGGHHDRPRAQRPHQSRLGPTPEGAEDAAAELGFTLDTVGPSPATAEGQIALLQNMAAQEVNGIILLPVDSAALVPAIDEVVGEGIPVVTTELDAPRLPACVLLLRWANTVDQGRFSADRVFQHFADAGATRPINFVVTSCLPTVTGQQDRLNGFTERVAELNADSPFQLFQVGFYNTTTDPAKNLANIQNIYTADGENIQLAYAMCEDLTPELGAGAQAERRQPHPRGGIRLAASDARPHRGGLDRLGTGQPLPGRQLHRQGAVRSPRQRHAAAEARRTAKPSGPMRQSRGGSQQPRRDDGGLIASTPS